MVLKPYAVVGVMRRTQSQLHFVLLFRAALTSLLVSSILSANLAIGQKAPAAAEGEKAPTFEVAAIKMSKPDNQGNSWNGRVDRITIENYTLRRLIRMAYGLKSETQVLGGPAWLDKQHFDVAAKIDDADVARLKDANHEVWSKEIDLMLQSLLSDRFGLKVDQRQQMLPVYALVVSKSGAKLTALPFPTGDEAKHMNHSVNTSNGHMVAKAISMDSLADFLTEQSDTGDRVVLNRTGLAGEFDLSLNWTQDRGGGVPADSADPGLFTALQEELGLELKADKGSIPVVAVLAVSKPDLD